MSERRAAAPDWERLLDGACAGEGLTSHYQPIVDLARGTVVGYEALARFVDHPVTRPDLWFDAAREHGRVAELEAAALRVALRRRADLPGNTFLTVNLGPDVLGEPLVQEVLGEQRSLDGLVVELTEHARVDDYGRLEPLLDRLRGEGAMIALDDAGSGYAGLAHMLSIRPDFIKLDRAFVSGVERDEAKQALVEMVGTLASRLDAWLLAEGIETRAELDTLARMGVPLAQGFLLAKPAAEWAPLDPGVALHLAARARSSRGADSTLRALMEDAIAVSNADEGRGWFALDHVEIVVVVDEHQRPIATLDESGLVTSLTSGGLRINLDTAIVEAAHRAVARPRGTRAAPLVCIDNAGRYVGVVRMERVLKWLASSVQPEQALMLEVG